MNHQYFFLLILEFSPILISTTHSFFFITLQQFHSKKIIILILRQGCQHLPRYAEMVAILGRIDRDNIDAIKIDISIIFIHAINFVLIQLSYNMHALRN